MALEVGSLYVSLRADTSGYSAQMADARKSLESVGRGAEQMSAQVRTSTESAAGGFTVMKGAAAAMAAEFAGRALGSIVDFARSSVEAASRVQEANNLIAVSFGESEKRVRAWASEFSAATGRGSQGLVELAGRMQSILAPMLGSKSAAADMSTALAKLSVDLSSFYNVSESDALNALRSGIIGETEPLRQFGIIVNEATLKTEALAMGLNKKTSEMTAAEKATATYNAILRQTSMAQGDAANTADSYANRTRALSDAWESLKVSIGSLSVKPAAEGVGLLTSLVQKLKSAVDEVGVAAASMSARMGSVFAQLGQEIRRALDIDVAGMMGKATASSLPKIKDLYGKPGAVAWDTLGEKAGAGMAALYRAQPVATAAASSVPVAKGGERAGDAAVEAFRAFSKSQAAEWKAVTDEGKRLSEQIRQQQADRYAWESETLRQQEASDAMRAKATKALGAAREKYEAQQAAESESRSRALADMARRSAERMDEALKAIDKIPDAMNPIQAAIYAGGPLAKETLKSAPVGQVTSNVIAGASEGGIIGALGGLLAASKPVAEMFAALEGVLQPLANLLGVVLMPVLLPLTWVFKKLGEGINWLLEKIADALSWLGLDSAADMVRPETAVKSVTGLATSATNASAALDTFSESVSNAPTGFKANVARYGAIDAAGGMSMAALEAKMLRGLSSASGSVYPGLPQYAQG